MSKIEEAQEILKNFGLPPAQYNELSALTLLALCEISEKDKWISATNKSLGVSKGIMSFVNENFDRNYAPNSRETFRRQVLHQFVQARIVNYNPDNPTLPVNSPNAHYALTEEALVVIKSYGKTGYKKKLTEFTTSVGKLSEVYLKQRSLTQIPVTLSDGKVLNLSAGEHNQLQTSIVEQFAPRFAKGGKLLYLGDTAKKDLYVDETGLKT